MTLGETIRQIRRNANLTQKELAKKIGLTHTYIFFVEKGQQFPPYRTLEKIANGLGLTVGDLLHSSLDETESDSKVYKKSKKLIQSMLSKLRK